MLRRIISTLLALAVLAERAAVRSLPVRILLFWILRRAALAAQSLVCPADARGPTCFALPADLDSGVRPLDLLSLAACFRTIAAMLAGLLGQDRRDWRALRDWPTSPLWGGRTGTGGPGVGLLVPGNQARLPGTALLNDTS